MNVFERIALEVLEEQRDSRLTDTKFNIVDTNAINNYVNKNFVNEFARRILNLCSTYHGDNIDKMLNKYMNIDNMYVVVTTKDNGYAVCYKNGKTPFIGSLAEAKALLKELEAWDQDEEFDYYICRLTNYTSAANKA